MEQITINPNNEPYYSEDFIKGFKCGAQRQFEADKADRPQDDDWEKYSEKLWRNAYERGKEEEHRWWTEHCANCTDADRPQGEWIEHEHGFWTFVNDRGERDGWLPDYECNLCGSRAWRYATNYCPNCGARMKGADDDNHD